MKLRSLRLVHFRGIDECRLEFPERGVIVVEGPNEIGKSSLAEALDLLLEELDSTKKRSVLDIQPVDKDVGPEVEAVIESGAYRFFFRKRFVKKPETVLRVEKPRAENLTGRAAHERVQRILEETMDIGLWRALRVTQGKAFEHTPLDQAPSLLRALDAAAGQETAGDRETTLFDRVQAECAIYYTETGKERAPLTKAAEAEQAAGAELERVRADLAALERDVEHSGRLELRGSELRAELEKSRHSARQHEQELAALEKTQDQVSSLRMQASMADTAVGAAQREWQARSNLAESLGAAQSRLTRLEAEVARERPTLTEAERAARRCADELTKADAASSAAEAHYDRAGLDFKFRHYELDLKKMRGRRAAVAADRKRRSAATDLLAGTGLDAALHKALKDAYLDCERVRARAEAQGARIEIEALTDGAIELDDLRHELKSGARIEQTVSGSSRLEIPGVLRVEFKGGAGADALAEALAEAQASFGQLLSRAGVASLDEADEMMRKRAEAELIVEQCNGQIRQNLDDLTYEELVERIEGLEGYVSSYLAERTGDWPVPADYDEAKAAHRTARDARETAGAALVAARGRHEAAQLRYAGLKEAVAETAIEIKVAVRERDHAQGALSTERARKPDDRLKAELAQASDKARGARSVFDEAQRTLADRRPGAVRELAVNAEKVAARTARELRETEDELRELAGRLEVRGSEGLFEREQESITRHARLDRALGSIRARAGAARRLYTVMAAQREQARRAYAAPLREKIEQLGRFVFDASLNVELDDELAISARTLQGRTLPIESLSGGAREQLALISRLAAALLVDESDGVPLVLDDALGYSDPARLEGLGALLGHAGEHAQIIVLTCTPGRFRHVGDATVIRL
ncbi:MAG: ATP-binding protein [Planctomycetota bacterium]|jgi:energy-coupling factor transporter ATP-binding protein EcfA2